MKVRGSRILSFLLASAMVLTAQNGIVSAAENAAETGFETTGTITKKDSELELSVNGTEKTYGDYFEFTATPKEKEDSSLFAQVMALVDPPKVSFYAGDVYLGEAKVENSGKAVFNYWTTNRTVPAGTHTIRAVYSGSDSLNGTEETVEITINKKEATPFFWGTFSKTYDGNVTVPEGEFIRFSGLAEGDTGVSCEASVTYDTAAAGSGKTVTASNLRLTNGWDLYYTLTTDELVTHDGVIEKLGSAAGKEMDLYISKNQDKVYEADLSSLIPDLSEGLEYGDIEWSIEGVENLDGYYDAAGTGASISNGVLYLPVKAADADLQDGRIRVKLLSTNIEDIECSIQVHTQISGSGEQRRELNLHAGGYGTLYGCEGKL